MADGKNEGQASYPVNAAHMMRTTQLAQLQLSAMADTKASILMGHTASYSNQRRFVCPFDSRPRG